LVDISAKGEVVPMDLKKISFSLNPSIISISLKVSIKGEC
jgi:hypothetical protein